MIRKDKLNSEDSLNIRKESSDNKEQEKPTGQFFEQSAMTYFTEDPEESE